MHSLRTIALSRWGRRAGREKQKQRREHEQMLMAAKLVALGELAAGIGHELNSPLGAILGYSQTLVHQGTTLPKNVMQVLSAIEREALRCRTIIQDLLHFARKTDLEKTAVDLNSAMESALTLVASRARMSDTILRAELAPGLPPVLGNAIQLQQVLINLANNAIDAMPKGGTLTIRTELADHAGVPGVCLMVKDTGTGIAPDVLPHIYEPFFTTKPDGMGTGLGLGLVKEIVTTHGGSIHVESSSAGTQFRILFSAAVESASHPAHHAAA